MKKVFMTLAVVLMGLTAANAQLVIGGSLDLDGYTGTKQSENGVLTDKASDFFHFGFAPKVGYLLMDGKMEVGASLALNYGMYTNYNDYTYGGSQVYFLSGNSAKKTSVEQSLGISINPYVRYYFFQKGIFSLGVQAVIGLGGDFYMPQKYYAVKGDAAEWNSKDGKFEYTEIELTSTKARNLNDDAKDVHKSSFNYGLYVMPVMKLDLNEHWYMDLALNALGLYMEGDVTTWNSKRLNPNVEDGQYTISNKSTRFDAGFSAMNGSAVSVGFAYKF